MRAISGLKRPRKIKSAL